jgi:hypothetical protein
MVVQAQLQLLALGPGLQVVHQVLDQVPRLLQVLVQAPMLGPLQDQAQGHNLEVGKSTIDMCFIYLD